VINTPRTRYNLARAGSDLFVQNHKKILKPSNLHQKYTFFQPFYLLLVLD
jgi:hypothetical protein